ncbi:MAG: FmdB family zinc ribbon protein [Egibacteraceae bacterium]
MWSQAQRRADGPVLQGPLWASSLRAVLRGRCRTSVLVGQATEAFPEETPMPDEVLPSAQRRREPARGLRMARQDRQCPGTGRTATAGKQNTGESRPRQACTRMAAEAHAWRGLAAQTVVVDATAPTAGGRGRVRGMPRYEFVCTDCGRRLEVRATMTEKAAGLAPRCLHCEDGGRVRRVFSAVALVSGRRLSAGTVSQGGGCCGGSCGCGAG